LQTLHGFTFGAAHLGAMAFLTKHVPKEISATGQSLYYTLIGGIFSGCMLPLAGKLYSDLSGSAFFIMSCFAGCSLISLLVLSRIVRHDFKAIKG
jgi:PPP family 3-phenylpropionic acid transporter